MALAFFADRNFYWSNITWIVDTRRVTFFLEIFPDSNRFYFRTFDFFETANIWHSTKTWTSSRTYSGAWIRFIHFDWFFNGLLPFKWVTWSKRIEWTTWSCPTWCWRKSSRNESFRITWKIESVHHWIVIFWKFMLLCNLVFPDNPNFFNDWPIGGADFNLHLKTLSHLVPFRIWAIDRNIFLIKIASHWSKIVVIIKWLKLIELTWIEIFSFFIRRWCVGGEWSFSDSVWYSTPKTKRL